MSSQSHLQQRESSSAAYRDESLLRPYPSGKSSRGSCCYLYAFPIFSFFLGAAVASAVLLGVFGVVRLRSRSDLSGDVSVDFAFQVLNISTPRQLNKTLNVFVKFRYTEDTGRCPFSATDNTCPQYQLFMRDYILNTTLYPTEELPIEAEWERVNLKICRGLWGIYPNIGALSTSLQVNGDGRPASQRGPMPYEPGAHGTTCTIGADATFAPVEFYNRLPDYE